MLEFPASLQNSYSNITTNTTTVLRSSPGVLNRIVINNPVATGVITIYDNGAASGAKIATITTPASPTGPVTILYDVAFFTGLTIVTSVAAQDITVSYR